MLFGSDLVYAIRIADVIPAQTSFYTNQELMIYYLHNTHQTRSLFSFATTSHHNEDITCCNYAWVFL